MPIIKPGVLGEKRKRYLCAMPPQAKGFDYVFGWTPIKHGLKHQYLNRLRTRKYGARSSSIRRKPSLCIPRQGRTMTNNTSWLIKWSIASTENCAESFEAISCVTVIRGAHKTCMQPLFSVNTVTRKNRIFATDAIILCQLPTSND